MSDETSPATDVPTEDEIARGAAWLRRVATFMDDYPDAIAEAIALTMEAVDLGFDFESIAARASTLIVPKDATPAAPDAHDLETPEPELAGTFCELHGQVHEGAENCPKRG